MLLHSPNPLSLLPPWHTVESSSGASQPQPQPRPVFSAASTSCLLEAKLQLPPFTFYDAPCRAAWRLYITATGTGSLWPAVSQLAAPARAQGPGPGPGQRGEAGRAQLGARKPGGQ